MRHISILYHYNLYVCLYILRCSKVQVNIPSPLPCAAPPHHLSHNTCYPAALFYKTPFSVYSLTRLVIFRLPKSHIWRNKIKKKNDTDSQRPLVIYCENEEPVKLNSQVKNKKKVLWNSNFMPVSLRCLQRFNLWTHTSALIHFKFHTVTYLSDCRRGLDW